MQWKRLIFFTLIFGAFYGASRQEELDALHLPQKLTGEGWHRIGVRDHYGVDVPLLSIHSEKSAGCGEYYDLIPLVNWLHSMGMDILQLLPINDTGDIVSPYSPLSFYALHPIYLSLEVLPEIRNAPRDLWDDLNELRKMTKTRRVDYFGVLNRKTAFLEEYVEHFKEKLMDRTEYHEFMKRASYWITDYALYKVLRKQYGSSWMKWPKEFQYPTPEKIDELKEKFSKEMEFYQIVQSLCFEQLEKVRHYANQHGVFILGDMTFLIDANSSTVWRHPDFFKLDKSVGVPVETEIPEGQDWSLPPYNWKEIRESQTPMLTERIRCFSQIYDIYRLDNSLGYFAQYEIPSGMHPKDGAYVPANEEEALENGKWVITSFVHAMPQLLPYAEAFALSRRMYQMLEDFGIAKLKTYAGTNNTHSINHLLYNGDHLPFLILFMLSNHDNQPLRKWWYNHPEKATRLATSYGWKYRKNLTTDQQKSLIQMVYRARSIFHINMLYDLIPAKFSYPPNEEGINVPGTFSDENWTYRFRLSVEEITKNSLIRSLATPETKMKSVQTNAQGSL